MTQDDTTTITGREPHLSSAYAGQGQRRLSILGVANLLNLLPAEMISLPAYAEALKSDAFYVRYSAAQKLSQRADREARMLMQDILFNGSAVSRASVARHLYAFSWFSAEPLLRHALKDADPRVRSAAMYALCDLREGEAFKLMAEALKHEVDSVRQAAAWGLKNVQDAAALPVLEAVLLANDPDVRVSALEAIGTMELPQSMPMLRGALNDPDPNVKYAATLSLIELAGEACLQELSGMIGRTSGVTLQQILRGFFHATNYLKIDVAATKAADLMIDALETALFDTLPETRIAAIWPLAWMRHPRMPGILRSAYFREADSEVKAEIVRVAVSLESGAGDELLDDAFQSADPVVKRAAEQVLGERAKRTVMR
ncbi:MAG TPA: HEAT repeat domain-containing protein [Aggregatilineales bacterium]|nr:HEAT repeat domain-containing protein [Aggregatilineales bacterium]